MTGDGDGPRRGRRRAAPSACSRRSTASACACCPPGDFSQGALRRHARLAHRRDRAVRDRLRGLARAPARGASRRSPASRRWSGTRARARGPRATSSPTRDERIRDLEAELRRAKAGRVDVQRVVDAAEAAAGPYGPCCGREVEADDMDELLAISRPRQAGAGRRAPPSCWARPPTARRTLVANLGARGRGRRALGRRGHPRGRPARGRRRGRQGRDGPRRAERTPRGCRRPSTPRPR